MLKGASHDYEMSPQARHLSQLAADMDISKDALIDALRISRAGAKITDRWNSAGNPMVYCASNIARPPWKR